MGLASFLAGVVVATAVSTPPAAGPVAALDGFALQTLPRGFALASEPEVYGTPARRERSGTVFDYIDGGGQVYIAHGLRKLLHVRMRDAEQRVLTLDVFDLGSPANAAAALADEGICAPGAKPVDVGVPAKVHHYPPEYLLYLVKGRFLVYLAATDELADVVRALARQTAAAIH